MPVRHFLALFLFSFLCALCEAQLTDTELPSGDEDSVIYNKRSEAEDKRVIPFSGGLYGKRSLPLYARDWYSKRGSLPFSGGLYGKRVSDSVPFHGGIYGKRGRALPFSGGVYGKRASIPYKRVPFQGGIYGKRAALPLSGGLYGKRSADNEIFSPNRLSIRSVPMSGGFFG